MRHVSEELRVPLLYRDHGYAQVVIDAPHEWPRMVRFRFDDIVAERGWFCLPAEMFLAKDSR